MHTQAHVIIITQTNRAYANDRQNNIIISSDLFEMYNYPDKTYLRGGVGRYTIKKYALIYYLGIRFG